jgi:inosine-uridine nucleoside N-ribohydrolase
MKSITVLFLFLFLLVGGCGQSRKDNNQKENDQTKKRVLFDTDTNNELDDQHALAYLLFNGEVFDVEGITVNATPNGGKVEKQYAEARRVMQMCQVYQDIPLHKGANGTFHEIKDHLENKEFDGSEAVRFIIDQALKDAKRKLILLPVGKLTNIALALKKEPDIAKNVRIVWLGSNYPEPGEYNQNADTAAMNYILNQEVPFEIVTVRYGKPSGTAAVTVTKKQILNKMPGIGPHISAPVEGRHGGTFDNFGDYSVNLFKNANMHGDPPSRSLFDMAAVAIVKNPGWAESKEIAAPILIDDKWRERPDNSRKITLWEHFDKKEIIQDFYETMNDPEIASIESNNDLK